MDYGGINAKVKAMRGNMLSYDDYFMIARYKSVKDVALKIAEYKAYTSALAGLSEEEFHREPVEMKIFLSATTEFNRLCSFISDRNLRWYINAYLSKNKIRTAKLNSTTNAEFIENLRGTEFYKAFFQKYSSDSSLGLFDLETELDLYYYVRLDSASRRYLDMKNKKVVGLINGTEIDMKNIVWLYRFKRFYKLNGNEIYPYLIPVNYRLSRDSIIRMAEAKTLHELESEIDNSPYARVFTDKDHIEKGLYSEMKKTFLRARALYPLSLAPVMSYIYHKDIEMRNITTVIEGVRYGLKPDDILKHIIGL